MHYVVRSPERGRRNVGGIQLVTPSFESYITLAQQTTWYFCWPSFYGQHKSFCRTAAN